MGFNAAGVLAVAEVIFRPHLLVPRITIKDIRQLDLDKLRRRGIVGVVLDKDNCLTKPRRDAVVEELKEAWPQLVKAFGRRNVLIVSNSAGTRDDAGLLQAESVSRQLGVPVLLHATKKPGCSNAVIEYFQHIQSVGRPLNDTRSDVVKGKGKGKAFYQSDYPPVPVVDIRPSTSHDASCVQSPITSLETTVDLPTGTPTDETRILVIGDRVMTDVVLANRINRHRANTGSRKVRAIAVLTTTIWEMEGLGSRIMRVIETFATRRVEAFDLRRRGVDDAAEYSDCLLEAAKPPAVVPPFSPPTRQTSRSRIPLKSRPLYSLVLGALSSILAWVTYPVRRLIFARYGRYADSIHTFISEARQNQYGFNAPLKYREISQARGLYRSWINRAILPRKG